MKKKSEAKNRKRQPRLAPAGLLAAVVQTQDDYIKALTEENGELVALAWWTHGWRSKRVEEGTKLRAKIARLKKAVNAPGERPATGDTR